MPEDIIIGLKTLEFKSIATSQNGDSRPRKFSFSPEQLDILLGLDTPELERRYTLGETLIQVILSDSMKEASTEEEKKVELEKIEIMVGNLTYQMDIIASIINSRSKE